MPIRRSHPGIPGAAVPVQEPMEGSRSRATEGGGGLDPVEERRFVVPELRRRTARLAELALDGRIVGRATGDEITMYEALDAAIGQQDIILVSDGAVELRGDLRFLNREHADLDGRLIVRRKGAADPVQTVPFGGAAGRARPALWRPAPTGAEEGASARRASR